MSLPKYKECNASLDKHPPVVQDVFVRLEVAFECGGTMTTFSRTWGWTALSITLKAAILGREGGR